MKLSQHVTGAIDDCGQGKFDSALLHACIAIDTTSKRLTPAEKRVGVRYINCLRGYYWIIEPMIGSGVNLIETKFSNITLKNTDTPDLAEVIYEIFRCSHAHGDEVPLEFSVLPSEGNFGSKWRLAKGELHMPDRVVWALLAVAVFSKINARENSEGSYYLSLGNDKFLLSEWWGREDDFRPIAEKSNQTRVRIDGLERLEERPRV
jgi:hypothetical protein